jgi:hypothetical protein
MTLSATGFRRIASLMGAACLTLALTASSCGGGSSSPADGGGAGTTGAGGTGVTVTGTPSELCSKVVTTFCNRLNSCTNADAGAADVATCITAFNVNFGCDRVAATVTGFDDCLRDILAVSCATLFPTDSTGAQSTALPGACNAPLNAVPASAAQQQCGDLAQTYCMAGLACLQDTDATDLQNCVQDTAVNALSCGFATGESATFDTCTTDLQKAPCSLFTGDTDGGAGDGGTGSPPSCTNVITYPPGF